MSLVVDVASSAPPCVSVGDLIGNYRIERKLAEGGMGTVYVATHIVLPRRVALKILRPELLHLEGARKGLVNEACILECMRDERVARLFDAGILADGRPWLAMELVEGECLADMLARRGKLTVAETAPIVSSIVDALAAAHIAGYVHGDVKPENVILCGSGPALSVKLIDWGIAKSPSGSSHEGQMAVGTPHYMAPEQVRGEAIDLRADVYSLGVLTYELLVGTPPFVGDCPTELAVQHLTKKPRAVRELCPEVPPAIDALVQKMLGKAREDRPMLETVRACFSLVTEAALGIHDVNDFDEVEITVEVPRVQVELIAGAGELTRKESPRARWTPQTSHHAIADHATLRLGRVVNSSGKSSAAAAGTIALRSNRA